MAAKDNGRSTPDPETFIPESTGRIGIGTPAAMWDAVREGAGIPPPQPDPLPGALTDGRDITAAFTELIAEGKACAYMVLGRTVHQGFRFETSRNHWRSAWESFEAEHKGLLRSFKANGGSDLYESTFKRALRTWTAVVPRLFTDEEARAHVEHEKSWGEEVERSTDLLLDFVAKRYQRFCKEWGTEDPQGNGLRQFRTEHYALPDLTDAQLRKHFTRHPWPKWYRNGSTVDQVPVDGPDVEGLPFGSKIIPTSAEVTTEERHRLWVEVFTAEVEICVERFKDHKELAHEMRRLIAELKDFEIGQGEAKAFVEHLRTTGAGRDVLRKMQDGKARLLLRLEELCAEYAPAEAGASNGQPIRWKGNTMELAELIHILETQGWIDGGRTRSKLAERVAAAFVGTDGARLHLPTLKTYLGKQYTRTPREGVEFTATRNPDVT